MRKLLNHELHRLSVEEYRSASKRPIIIVLDNIRSAHNIGAAFRSADAFCVEKIILCGICAVPPNSEIHKAALGAEFAVAWQYFPTTIEAVSQLRSDGYNLISVEQTENSIPLNSISHADLLPAALIFGNEISGVSQDVVDVCKTCIEIPQFGTKHSLNVSVSIGIVLWELCRV